MYSVHNVYYILCTTHCVLHTVYYILCTTHCVLQSLPHVFQWKISKEKNISTASALYLCLLSSCCLYYFVDRRIVVEEKLLPPVSNACVCVCLCPPRLPLPPPHQMRRKLRCLPLLHTTKLPTSSHPEQVEHISCMCVLTISLFINIVQNVHFSHFTASDVFTKMCQHFPLA